jgi:hypothetical protein
MNDIWLFAFGTIIVGGYLFGLLSMINSQHKIQAREHDHYMKSQADKTS